MPEKTSNPIGDPDRSTIRDSSHTGRMADGTTAPGTDEAVLLQRIRQGDQSAMAEVFDRYGRAVYSVALRILKDTGHAEDVMQEIFFQVWRNSDSFVPGRGSLGAWLVVVAAEMIAVDSGLGYLVIDSRNSGKRYDLVVAAILLIGVIGLVLDVGFRRLEKLRSVRWGFRVES